MEALALDSAPTVAPGLARGRPREFCTQAALAAALGVFWAKGYEGASMAELTAAMGITKPSLYAAFGNKEALFCKALDLYEAEKLAYTRVALDQPSARGVAEHFLRGAVEMMTGAGDPHGCMAVIGTTACGSEAEGIKAEVIKRRASSSEALVARFERARDDGDLPAGIEPAALAQFLYTLLGGLSVQAGAGATRADLERVVDTSLTVWPGR